MEIDSRCAISLINVNSSLEGLKKVEHRSPLFRHQRAQHQGHGQTNDAVFHGLLNKAREMGHTAC